MPAEIYRVLIESTIFGTLTIIQHFQQYSTNIKQMINCGDISEKNALVMQIYADVYGRPIKISQSVRPFGSTVQRDEGIA